MNLICPEPQSRRGLWRLVGLAAILMGTALGTAAPSAGSSAAETSATSVASPEQAVSRAARGEPLALVSWARLDSLPDGSAPPLRNGSTLRLLTTWTRSDLTVSADLTSLDPEGPDSTLLEAETGMPGAFLLEYTLPDSVTRIDGADIPIPLTAVAPDTSVLEATAVTVCLSNTTPALVSAEIDPDRAAYRGGDVLHIRATWSSPIDMANMRVDVGEIQPSLADSLLLAESEPGVFTLDYAIPAFAADRGPEGVPLVIGLHGEDNGCGVAVDSSLSIILNEDALFDPVLLEWRFEGPGDLIDDELVVHNGETVRLITRWDREDLALSADFFSIAPEDTARAFVEELGGGEYRIVYQIPADNPAPDGSGRAITLIAEDERGERTIDESVRLCLSNSPPVLLESRIDPLLPLYTRGDTVRVVSRWSSALGTTNMTVGLDVSEIQPGFSGLVQATREGAAGADSFVALFRIPFQREQVAMDGPGLALPLVGRDAGCGIVRDEVLRFDLDVTPPSQLPLLDPLPAQTSADSIRVTGVAPEAALVGVLSFSTFRTFVAPDSAGRFAGTIELLPDRPNPITVLSEDAVGNRTLQTEAVRVLQVSGAALAVPTPFTRGSEILLRDPRGLREVTVRLFDLEGSALREWRLDAGGLEQGFVWDGTDANGDRARQGYFLLRAEWTRDDGSRSETVVGLVLQD